MLAMHILLPNHTNLKNIRAIQKRCFCGSDLLCISALCLLCLCACLFICALWSPAGKRLTSWLSFVVSNCEFALSHRYPGSGVILDCIDS